MAATRSKRTTKTDSNIVEEPTITDPSIIAKELLDQALDLDIQVETKLDKTIDQSTFNSITNDISKHYNVTLALALVGLFSTLQAGGTNNNKRSNIKITISKTSFESRVINSFIIRNCKNITPRQLARIFANQIYACAVKYGITGNAYTYLLRYHSNLLETEDKVVTDRFWCADFQVDNSECPEYIRYALRQRYNDKFRKKI